MLIFWIIIVIVAALVGLALMSAHTRSQKSTQVAPPAGELEVVNKPEPMRQAGKYGAVVKPGDHFGRSSGVTAKPKNDTSQTKTAPAVKPDEDFERLKKAKAWTPGRTSPDK